MLEIYLLQANIGGKAIYRVCKDISNWMKDFKYTSIEYLLFHYYLRRISFHPIEQGCLYSELWLLPLLAPCVCGPSPAVCTVPRASILLFKIWEIERSESGENKVDIRYKVEILSDQSKKEVQDINTKYIYRRWTTGPQHINLRLVE